MADTPEIKKLDTLAKNQDEQAKTLDKINQSIQDQTRVLQTPPKTDIEGKKEAQQNQKNFLSDLLKGINKAMTGSMKGAKAGAGMLGKFLKFGLGFIMVPFLGLIGVIAGVISGIMKSPEVKFMLGILKTIGKTAIGFVKFMGSIGRWMLNLLPGGKIGTGLFNVFGKMGTTISGMFKGWSAKIATFLEHPKIVAVMGKVSKFIKPLARIAFWLFSAWEFLKGWKQADEIFGKGEGEATIVEKFAGGIGAIIQFLTFGFIDTETAAIALKKTFDFFKLAITKPGEAWKQVVDWWDAFSFKDSVVTPMLAMFEDFPKKIRAFIDGPLSNFGSMATTMLKNFIFGKDDPKAKEGDPKTGGLWGGIKSLFSAENISKAIGGMATLMVGWNLMLLDLISIIFIGTKGKWGGPLSDWGGVFGGAIKIILGQVKALKEGTFGISVETQNAIGTWAKNIFWHDDGESGLIQKLMAWFSDLMTKFDVVGKLKSIPGVGAILGVMGIGKDPSMEREAKRYELKTTIEEQEKEIAGGDTRTMGFRSRQGIIDDAKKELAEMEVAHKKRMRRPTEDILKSGAVTMAKGQTRASSWTGQSEFAKHKMNIMGGMFKGGIRVTSGFRDPSRGDEAMLQSKEGLSKYKEKWRNMLTAEELNAAAGTEARASGIAKMRAGGFSSEHEHGNAIDFSYPAGYSQENFSALKGKILGTFPGSNLIKEKDHLHMAFDRKTTGVQLASLQNEQGQLQGQIGAGGAGGGVTINKGGDNSNTESYSTPPTQRDVAVHVNAKV